MLSVDLAFVFTIKYVSKTERLKSS
jgi:hypothetical protein